jgi:hypothetical protein
MVFAEKWEEFQPKYIEKEYSFNWIALLIPVVTCPAFVILITWWFTMNRNERIEAY